MVAHEDGRAVVLLQVAAEFEDAHGVGPAVDHVAEHEDAVPLAGRHTVEQPLECAHVPVHI